MKYTLTCTAEQLAAIGNALEACFRMGIGQPDDALAYARNAAGQQAIWSGDSVEIIARIKQLCGLGGPGNSYGVGKFKEIDGLWEMRAAIRYRLAWDSAIDRGIVERGSPRTKEMFGVNYDEPMKYTDAPPIVVERAEEPSRKTLQMLIDEVVKCEIANEGKGGGDPRDIPAIEADLKSARLALKNELSKLK